MLIVIVGTELTLPLSTDLVMFSFLLILSGGYTPVKQSALYINIWNKCFLVTSGKHFILLVSFKLCLRIVAILNVSSQNREKQGRPRTSSSVDSSVIDTERPTWQNVVANRVLAFTKYGY